MDLTVTKPMKLMRGATTSLIYLFGQQRPRITQRRQWLGGGLSPGPLERRRFHLLNGTRRQH
jgi:hypothetical protein